MKIDLLYAAPIAGAPNRVDGHRVQSEILEQIEAADELGFACVWAMEHDFLAGTARSAASEILLSAAAVRTKRIRIGCGITLLPAPFNHPIRVAERVATLDVISNGRVEWSTGPVGAAEQERLEVDPELARALWLESLEMIPRMWDRSQPFSHQSEHFDISEREVIPKPLQDPHPPIWGAAQDPASWQAAGDHGIGVLGVSTGFPIGALRERIQRYRLAIPVAKPVGRSVNEQVALLAFAHCAESPEKATNEDARFAAAAFLDASSEDPAEHAIPDVDSDDRVMIGDVDHCVRRLEALRDAGCDRVLLLAGAKPIPHFAVMRSLTLFGREIIPYFDRS